MEGSIILPVVVFIAALVPVLILGAALMDLLFFHAPRRGKWPDARPATPPTRLAGWLVRWWLGLRRRRQQRRPAR